MKRLDGTINLKDVNSQILQLWRSAFVYIVLVALIVIFSLINEKFFSLENFFVIGRQTAITAVVAFGMTFVITTAQIDLSAGSIVGVGVMERIVIKAFLISGFLSAISGLMMVSRINAGRPEVGADLALDSITAVILGGTSLFGGKGSIVKTLVGALMITMITNALIIFGFQINVQMIVKGLIVIAAVSISEKQL